ncbi:hypothetical protein TUM17561_33090 [Enterobacter cloacae]|nr:hypothetical protein TUM17561_33090 [Enterobacter cloacae]
MMTLITINRVYYLIGFVVMLLVVMTLRDRANPSWRVLVWSAKGTIKWLPMPSAKPRQRG